MTLVEKLRRRVPIRKWSVALDISRATIYRLKNPPIKKFPTARKKSFRALSQQEVSEVNNTLHSPRFLDASPAHVW